MINFDNREGKSPLLTTTSHLIYSQMVADISSSTTHAVYVVLSEEEYGGGANTVKVFYRLSNAENYLLNGLDGRDGLLHEFEIRSPWNKVFVVVFETFFGGDHHVGCFTSQNEANDYLSVVGHELGIDGEIIERDVMLIQ